ncbi:MAG TPA: alpha/beta fold hydrolase [Longimicrobium sp.]|jgi:pimeloyl-ACP methyl ester carboxylesterase
MPLSGPRAVLAATLLAAAGCGSLPGAVGRTPPPGLAACRVAGLEETAWCGTVRVPEDRAAPSGRRIALRVVVLPARSPRPEPDPVFFLSGGPGQAATGGAAALARELAGVRAARDLVLVDQRGTGGPDRLSCPLGSPARSLRAWTTGEFPADRLAACLREWRADPRLYTTERAVEDLDQVRAELGYGRVNLVGASYGTRPALAYLRRFPDRVRTVVLRGVYPAFAPLPLHVSADAQAALDRLAAGAPGLRRDVERALARADSAPVRLPLEAEDGGAPDTLLVTRGVLAGALLFALYSAEQARAIPDAARAAAAGDPRPWVELAAGGTMLPVLESLSPGVFLSVVCAEDLPQVDSAAMARAAAGTFLGDVLYRNFARACAGWPRGAPPAGHADPVRSDAPVLVISGDADPVTPPRWGERVLATLSRGAHLVLPGTGHVPSFPPCARRAAAELVARGSAEGLDLSCARDAETATAGADTLPVAADSTGPPADVAGRWALFWRTDEGPRESGWIELRQAGDSVGATLHGQGSLEAAGTVRGRLLVVSGRRMMARFEIRAAVQGDTLHGELRVLALRRPFTAVRRR